MKIVSKKLDSEKLQVAHRKLGRNKILILTNPENNKSIELKISKKAKYPNFFNVLITKKVSDELDLNSEFPFLESLPQLAENISETNLKLVNKCANHQKSFPDSLIFTKIQK